MLFVRVVFLFILMLVDVMEIVVIVVGVFVVMIIGIVVSLRNVVLVIIFFNSEDFCFWVIFF